MSRIAQTLGKIHWLKDRDGYDYVERIFDARDNRRRTLKLTPKGDKAMQRVWEALRA